jgi:tyrosyl-tRNA synthetase
MSMKLSEELIWRGFLQQTTLQDLTVLDKQKIVFYHGFDGSADSQTIGNLAAMMLDRLFLRHGHKAVMLAGGATSLIGDPGGKDKERILQDEVTIAKNVENARDELTRILRGYDFIMVNNLDWTKKMSVIDFLRDIGKHFSMTPLVQRDYIAKRIGEGGSGISYTEFSYTLLQGMDFLHLYDTYGVTLQLGGSDQWGNCISGVDLIRKARGAEAHVITLPLIINQATGKKFGKSEEGAVWLNPAKTSPYKFYQFWLNIDDQGSEGYLKTYTELGKQQIDDLIREHQVNPQHRIAQKTLAREVTTLVHGQEACDAAESVTNIIFGGQSFRNATKEQAKILSDELPRHQISKSNLTNLDLPEIIVQLGLASSKREAREFIVAGSIKLNQQQITSLDHHISQDNDIVHGIVLVQRGKNAAGILQIV